MTEAKHHRSTFKDKRHIKVGFDKIFDLLYKGLHDLHKRIAKSILISFKMIIIGNFVLEHNLLYIKSIIIHLYDSRLTII